jgi:hypothetical protein
MGTGHGIRQLPHTKVHRICRDYLHDNSPKYNLKNHGQINGQFFMGAGHGIYSFFDYPHHNLCRDPTISPSSALPFP